MTSRLLEFPAFESGAPVNFSASGFRLCAPPACVTRASPKPNGRTNRVREPGATHQA